MERQLTEKEKETIINLGALGYDARRCSIILNIALSQIENMRDDKQSEFSLLYEKGSVKADYVISLKLFEQAQQGDIQSIKAFEDRKSKKRRK